MRDKFKPIRPAWLEIDLYQFRRNFALINQDKPEHLKLLFVVKDNAYGHGGDRAGTDCR